MKLMTLDAIVRIVSEEQRERSDETCLLHCRKSSAILPQRDDAERFNLFLGKQLPALERAAKETEDIGGKKRELAGNV